MLRVLLYYLTESTRSKFSQVSANPSAGGYKRNIYKQVQTRHSETMSKDDVVMYDQSLRSLPLLESRRNRTQDQPLVFRLHVTDGFRSHGNLTPPRGRRVSP
jgi:hypothetical protein